MSPGDLDICMEKCAELMAAGLIQRSDSNYVAATVMVSRQDLTGEVSARRMCGDYYGINKVTTTDRYPMQSAEEIFDKLQGAAVSCNPSLGSIGDHQWTSDTPSHWDARSAHTGIRTRDLRSDTMSESQSLDHWDKRAYTVFSTLDLRQGFNHIPIRAQDRKKTAFHGPDGLYEWRFTPFGMKNASALFQKTMDAALRGVPAAACYIDDVIVFTPNAEQHVNDMKAALEAIAAAGLTCHPKKCSFGNTSVMYLGFEVEGGTLGIKQAKVEVLDWVPPPKDRNTLRAVLGFLNYYKRFVPNFSKTASVLNGLLREELKWQWGEAEQGALKSFLKAIKSAAVLTLPNREDPFTLYTDWSSSGMGAILCQNRGEEEMVVAFAVRSCNPAEANCSSYEGESLAAVWAISHFRVYLQGRPFELVTDHQPLT
ncbi:unnamed protein product [Closterium sp. NIES-54]